VTGHPVRLEHGDGIAVLTLDRPEARNAITDRDMLDAIISALEQADTDPSIRVLVVTGAGGAFSAGGNVKDMRNRSGIFGGTPAEVSEAYRTTIQQIPRLLATTDLVTIAAVDGPAIGAGFDLALMCDLRLASSRARFAHSFVDLGILPGDGGAWFLTRILGWQRAAELSFSARHVDADEAARIGLVLEVLDPADLMPRALDLARTIAAKPPYSVRLTKRLLRAARSLPLEEFLDLTAAHQAIAHHTDDHAEAMDAFFERRPGRFTGR
jgi:enoyl-CoA hydratase/carnithine racemase